MKLVEFVTLNRDKDLKHFDKFKKKKTMLVLLAISIDCQFSKSVN